MTPSSTRARALGLARRLAVGALQRLAREVDRLSLAIEPLRAAIPLRESERWGREVEVEVRRSTATSSAAAVVAASSSEAEVSSSPAPVVAASSNEAEPGPGSVPGPSSIAKEPPAAPASDAKPAAATAVELPPALALVTHVRALVEPPLERLRGGLSWDRADELVDAVHRVRVASRRLRAFVRLFAPLVGEKRARKLERELRAITRALGPVREWDVLLAGLAAEHTYTEPLTQAALEHVTAWAQAHRRKAVRRAERALDRVDVPSLATTLDGELDRVCGRLLRRDDEPLSARAAALLEPERARAFEDMPAPEQETDIEALHEVRIRAKRLRYALELVLPALPETHHGLRPALRRVQSAIGEHREAAQLGDRLHERHTSLCAQGLHTLAGALAPVEAVARERQQHAFEHATRALERLAVHRSGSPTPSIA